MVLPGQFLERSVVVGGIDALYHRGRRPPPCAIASPHPALGGSMTAPVIAELAWALTRAGHATMRFDYRGVGASSGVSGHAAGSLRIGEVSAEVEDLRRICDQLLASSGLSALCAVGYSFGARVALEAARDPRLSHLVLVAPPNRLGDFSALPAVRQPLLVVCAQDDAYCDRATLRLPEQARLEVVPHADHFFGRGLTELGRLVADWLGGDGGARELDPGEGEPLELETDPK